MTMAKSLQIDCSTGEQKIIDIPDETKPPEDNSFDLVKEKSKARKYKATQLLAGLNGLDIGKMSKNKQTELLIALCQMMGIADENNIIDVT